MRISGCSFCFAKGRGGFGNIVAIFFSSIESFDSVFSSAGPHTGLPKDLLPPIPGEKSVGDTRARFRRILRSLQTTNGPSTNSKTHEPTKDAIRATEGDWLCLAAAELEEEEGSRDCVENGMLLEGIEVEGVENVVVGGVALLGGASELELAAASSEGSRFVVGILRIGRDNNAGVVGMNVCTEVVSGWIAGVTRSAEGFGTEKLGDTTRVVRPSAGIELSKE
jgi:hypothetical protein